MWKRKFENKIEEIPKIQDIMNGLNFLRTGDATIISSTLSEWNFMIPKCDETGCYYEFCNTTSSSTRELTYIVQRSMSIYLTSGNWEPVDTKKLAKSKSIFGVQSKKMI